MFAFLNKERLTGASKTAAQKKDAAQRTVQKKQSAKSFFSVLPGSGSTGIPGPVKSRFEETSGLSFDDVRVHYHSDMPQKIGALAYTQGNQVYIGPGQEKYLGHELAHVAQQKQGIVKPTGNLMGLPVNEDVKLEKEADKMGRMYGQSAREKTENEPI